MISSMHPSREELVAFSVGQLSIIDSEVVEGHIGQFDPCCQTPFVSDTSYEEASAPQPVTKVRRSWWPPNRLAIAAVSAMGFVFALGTVVYVETDKGTLVIESVDDSVKVYISQETDQAGNSQIKTRVVDTVTGSEIKTLPSGEYKIELGKDGNEFELSQGGFQLRRGGKEVVRVSRKEVVDNSDSELEKQKATKPLMTLPRNVQQALSMKGNKISDDEVKQLEEKINLDANDFESRIVLMSYYYRKSILDKNFREPHLQQVYWFIENYPESDTAGSHSARIDAIMNPQGFVKGMDLWEKAMKANPSSVPVLVSASRYFMFSDKAKSEALLKQAQEMEPNNTDLMTKLAQLYSLSVISERTKDGRQEASKKSLELFERALLLESDSPNRTNLVVSAAKTAFDAGEFEKAKQFAEQLLKLDDKGDALHMGNTVLGRLAIQKGDLDSACNYLLESGKTAGSPVLGSFGPTMILAKELLVKGKKDAVLEYFELCSAFWKLDRGQLDIWSAIVKKDRIPDFGANLQR